MRAVAAAGNGVISGCDPRTGGHFVNEIFLFHTAAGASPMADGWLTLTGMGSAGLCLLDSVELDELRFPIHVYKQGIAVDSEGAGRRRGAPGAHVEFGPVDCEMTIAYASDGTMYPALGVRVAVPLRRRGRSGATRTGASINSMPAPRCGWDRVKSSFRLLNPAAAMDPRWSASRNGWKTTFQRAGLRLNVRGKHMVSFWTTREGSTRTRPGASEPCAAPGIEPRPAGPGVATGRFERMSVELGHKCRMRIFPTGSLADPVAMR